MQVSMRRAAPEGQPHGIKAQQLRAVDNGGKVSHLRVRAAPQPAHHRRAVVEAVPGERLPRPPSMREVRKQTRCTGIVAVRVRASFYSPHNTVLVPLNMYQKNTAGWELVQIIMRRCPR